MSPKKVGRSIVCVLLEGQVRRLRRKNSFQLVAVTGSVGKTSTKLAIARMLASKARVIFEDGNYNDRVTVPLIIFGRSEPNIYNVLAWIRILLLNELTLLRSFAYDYAVVEIGTDGPGDLKDFAYLKPDLVVLTAIEAEHMEFFETLEAVAAEELIPLSYSKQALVNTDSVKPEALGEHVYLSYGSAVSTDYRLISRTETDLSGQEIEIGLGTGDQIRLNCEMLGSQGALIAVAAAAVAHMYKFEPDYIKSALESLGPAPGRMQILAGVSGCKLIDDTYNASPVAVKAALDVLYASPAKQRIAILGSMNELGTLSEAEHREVGQYCDPTKLAYVVTIGKQAEIFLGPAAESAGCKVESFLSPYEAGQFVKKNLKAGAVVLAKGSQNGVFAEEAIKLLLADPADSLKLVRQSSGWLALKKKQFGG